MPVKLRGDRVAAEAEVVARLLADEDQAVVAALRPDVFLERALGLAQHAGVVATGEAAVGADHDEADLADRLAIGQQRVAATRAGRGEVADDLGDLLAVGTSGGDALLRLVNAAARR